MQDSIEGILLGLAAGDRNGGPIRMAVRIAESLVETRRIDVDDIGARYLHWWRDGAFDTGPTAARVLTLVDTGQSFDQASQQVHGDLGEMTAGCNPAHRSTPLAMFPNVARRELIDAVKAEANLTHRHPLSGDVAAAAAVLCNELATGVSWPDALQAASDARLPETVKALTHNGTSTLDNGGFAPDALAAAIHYLQTYNSFDDALEASIDFAGPANYCPVLVGSIGGARWGASSISASQLRHGSILPRIRDAAKQLSRAQRDHGHR